jgi:hypothetical protein
MAGRTMDKNRTVTWCERKGLVGLWINILVFTGASDEMRQDLRIANSLRTPANKRYHRTEDSHSTETGTCQTAASTPSLVGLGVRR